MNKGCQKAEVLVTYVAGGDLEDDEVQRESALLTTY